MGGWTWTGFALLAACGTPPSRDRGSSAPAAEVSGATLQDPTGFPRFHDYPAPPGPAPDPAGAWSAPVALSGADGGLRPQIAAAPDGTLHVVYYTHGQSGDLLRARRRPVANPCAATAPCAWTAWGEAEALGHPGGRNWGPDLVVREDGSAVVSYDHTDPQVSFAGQVFLTLWDGLGWSSPKALTENDGREVGSAHVADTGSGDLVVVWIERLLTPGAAFRAMSRWRLADHWTAPSPLPLPAQTGGRREAWHTNVERRLDGSVLAGWDLGQGGMDNQVLLTVGRAGAWRDPLDASAGRAWGERPHFAFAAPGVADDGTHAIWFERPRDQPRHIWYRSPSGELSDLAAGLGGFHYDPDIAINAAGTLCAVWGWDGGSEAELVYALNRGDGWTRAARVALLGHDKPGLPSITVSPDGAFQVAWVQWHRGAGKVWTASLP